MRIPSREAFVDLVADALKHFYDPARLETHDLADVLLCHEIRHETRGVSLRKVLAEAIEHLQPECGSPYSHDGWLPYRVLRLHYIEAVDQHRVCEQVGLGRTSFYKYQRIGLEALAGILWNRYERAAATRDREEADNRAVGAEGIAAELASRSQRQRVDLTRLMDGVEATVHPLAEIEGTVLEIEMPATGLVTYGDPAILRQLFISVLSESMRYAHGKLGLTGWAHEDEIRFRLSGLGSDVGLASALRETEGFQLARDVAEVYGGDVAFVRDQTDALTLMLTLPKAAATSILLIDDDEETLTLYRRYVQEQGYNVRAARSGQEMRARLREIKPDIILLDVLMPQEDGWSLLQELQVLPETADTPIIVCSVLSQPRLALALGAVEVLQKPVEPATLLRTLERWL